MAPARLTFAESKLPSLSAVLIWLAVIGIFGGIGWGIYQRVSGGYLEKDAAFLAEEKIRQAYVDIKRGLEIPDAHYLAPYVPNLHKRAVSDVDIKRKDDQLRPLQIRCDIDVQKVTPKVEENGRRLPSVSEVTAQIQVRISSQNSTPQTRSGTQVWRLKNGKWSADNWRMFGNAPLTFEKWRGDDESYD